MTDPTLAAGEPIAEFKADAEVLQKLVGTIVEWEVPSKVRKVWTVACLVVGFRYRYGRWDCRVVPLVGTGWTWAYLGNLMPTTSPTKFLSDDGAADLERRCNEALAG